MKKRADTALPASIEMGTRNIPIRVGHKDLENDRYAHFDTEVGEIVINPKTTETDRRVFLLHEWVHAVCHYRGLGLSVRQEERLAIVMGEDLAELIRKNPEVVKWVQR